MKKLLALLLCLVMLTALVACKSDETTENTTASESAAEEHDHAHINYRGYEHIFTPEDLAAMEGRECDFTYDQNGSTIYIYNNVSVEDLYFTQVQFTFNEDHTRVSCTYTADKGTDENPRDAAQIQTETEGVMEDFKQILTGLFGEGTETEQHGSAHISWSDHSGNYVILARINETTIQVAYYIYAVAS